MKLLFAIVMLLALAAPGLRADYDPLAVPKDAPPHQDMTVADAKRKREIPIRVYPPNEKTAAPVILFSHGLGGSREGSAFLGKHWAARGFVAVFLQHPGSDEGVWKNLKPGERMAAMKTAANVENFLLRVADVPAVLDQLAAWNADAEHTLKGRIDMKRVGMAGHSFGAVTTQAVGGQTAALGKSFTDARIRAALILSPSVPERGDANKAFGGVKIPWLLMTGTLDTSMIRGGDAKSRLLVYPALPAGEKYQLVLDKAEHSAFVERALPGDKVERNPNHHKAVMAISTAFWDAYLRGDADAKKWLDGDQVREVLEKNDLWQTK